MAGAKSVGFQWFLEPVAVELVVRLGHTRRAITNIKEEISLYHLKTFHSITEIRARRDLSVGPPVYYRPLSFAYIA